MANFNVSFMVSNFAKGQQIYYLKLEIHPRNNGYKFGS